MKLYIFNRNELLQAVIDSDGYTNEDCVLLSAIHTENLDGDNTLVFTVTADHPDAQYVREGWYAGYKEDNGRWQIFTMIRLVDRHDDASTRTMYCEHLYYELMEIINTDIRPYNVQSNFALQRAIENSDWQIGTSEPLGYNSTNFYYESSLESIRKVRKTWGGDFEFYLNKSITNPDAPFDRFIDYTAQRGQDTGKQYVFGKDIQSVEREVDTSQIVTALYGIGASEGDGQRKRRFQNSVWVKGTKPANKPALQEWVGDDTALATWGRRGRHIFGVVEFDTLDSDELLQLTWDELQRRKDPIVTYKLSVIDLEKLSTDYSHEGVLLGDTVRVIDKHFSPALKISVRVAEIARDLLFYENTEVTLGNQVFDYLEY